MGAISALRILSRPILLGPLLAAALVVCPAAVAAVEPKIVAGGDVSITDHPYQVLVRTQGVFACGGSIRDATHVRTAAHCVVDDESGSFPSILAPADVTVGYGSADRLFQLQSVGVTRVSVAPAFRRNPLSSVSDVAVLTLDRAIDLGGVAARAIPIASAAEFSKPLSGSVAGFATGWGTTVEGGGGGTRLLQGVSLPLLPDARCVARYGDAAQGGDYDANTMACGGGGSASPSGNPDTCQGDSGGPVVVDADPGAARAYRLVGIISFGDGCGRSGVPGVNAWAQGPLLRPFLEAATPAAPPAVPASNPTISGTLRVGATTTCNAPPQPAAQVARYFWWVFDPAGGGFTAVADAAAATLVLPSSTLGTRLVCDVRYESDGGFSYSDTPGAASVGPVLAALPPGGGETSPANAPPPPPAGTDPSPDARDAASPLARIAKVSCRRGTCTITVRASDVGGRVRSLAATLTHRVRRCRAAAGGGRRCRSVTRTRALRPRSRRGGFTITAALDPGAYTLTVRATDTSGNLSALARKSFRVSGEAKG